MQKIKKRYVKMSELKIMQELRKQNLPYSEIAKRVGLPKTTVWDHVNDINRDRK